MLFSNQDLKTEERNLDFGTIYQVSMGEYGRGRHLMTLTCPKETEIKDGWNPDVKVTETRSGRPRLSKGQEEDIYMMLSAEGGYTRRGNGTIWVPEKDKDDFHLLAKGNGADGDAGRIGFWECALLKTPDHDSIVRVRTSGAGYGTPSDLFVLHDREIYHCTLETLEECCDSLGIDVPIEIRRNEYGELCFGNDMVRATYLDIEKVSEIEERQAQGSNVGEDDTVGDER